MELNKTLLILMLSTFLVSGASNKKKSVEESESTKPSGPAILAIEIVDSNDTSAELRNNTKRTIESALGYGYQGNYYPTSSGKKYMIYPYSQHDIPPAKSSSDSGKYPVTQHLNIQKSVAYNLGTKTELGPVQMKEIFTPAATQTPSYHTQGSQGYYPSTLYSTVGQGGVIGGLSTNFPSQQQVPTATIPVIILRVYTNQLESPSIYPNLPQSHPYANDLNSINLQQILANYIQQYMQQALQQSYKPVAYQQPAHQTSKLVYQGYQGPSNYAYYQQPQQSVVEDSSASLPTSENYPSDSHTRVIYHGPRGHIPNLSYSSISASSSQEYASPKQTYPVVNQEYSSTKQSYPVASQEYGSPKQTYSSATASYSSPKQSYKTNQVYTDSNGQSFIYVYPSQLQKQQYYQQDYQPDYSQSSYASQDYSSQEYQPQEDRSYLPTPAPEIPQKIYNYHAEAAKDRTKKSNVGPVTFESKKIKDSNKNKN